jgi:hypothetical protein
VTTVLVVSAASKPKRRIRHQRFSNMRGAPELTKEEYTTIRLAQGRRWDLREEATELIYDLAAKLREFRRDGTYNPEYED